MVEITEFEGRQIPLDDWPEDAYYKGKLIWNIYYGYADESVESPARQRIEKEVRVYIDSFQESYLGYVPSEDKFVAGFDGDKSVYDKDDRYIDDKPVAVVVEFEMDEWGNTDNVNADLYYERFYRGRMANLEKKYDDLIHIRLD